MNEKELVLGKLKGRMKPHEFNKVKKNYGFIRYELFKEFVLLDEIKDIVNLIWDAREYIYDNLAKRV